jgi:hypothetical protein
MKVGYTIVATVLAACALSACDKPPVPVEATEVAAPAAPPPPPPPKFNAATRLDPNSGGITGGAVVEVGASGEFSVTDSNGADHATKFWSLSEVTPNADYLFQLRVKKDPAAAAAGLLQIDMQSGKTKTSYECAFSSKDGLIVGRNAAASPALTGADDGDAWVFDCPAKSGEKVDAVYAYIFPAVGGDPGSYDNKFTGALDVTAIGYTLTPAPAAVPAAAAPATPASAPATPTAPPQR